MSREDDDGAEAIDTISTVLVVAVTVLGALFVLLPLFWIIAEAYALINSRPEEGFRSDEGEGSMSRYYQWETATRVVWSLRMVLAAWLLSFAFMAPGFLDKTMSHLESVEMLDFLFDLGLSVLPFSLFVFILGFVGYKAVATWIVKSYDPKMSEFWRDPPRREPAPRLWGWAIAGYTAALVLTLAASSTFALVEPPAKKNRETGKVKSREVTPSCRGIKRRLLHSRRMQRKNPKKWERWVGYWRRKAKAEGCELP